MSRPLHICRSAARLCAWPTLSPAYHGLASEARSTTYALVEPGRVLVSTPRGVMTLSTEEITENVRVAGRCIQQGLTRLPDTTTGFPADIIGTLIFTQRDSEFKPRLGAIIDNLILADEIDRAPAKVQGALLEAMQERQVSIGQQSYPLPDPF